MSNINEMHQKVISKVEQYGNYSTNICIQVQSYNRVFIWDQLGHWVSKEEAICIYEGNSIDERIVKAYQELLQKIVELAESQSSIQI